jgi:hypothetical protein
MKLRRCSGASWIEVFNQGNYDAADGLIADTFYNHEAPDSPGTSGVQGERDVAAQRVS